MFKRFLMGLALVAAIGVGSLATSSTAEAGHGHCYRGGGFYGGYPAAYRPYRVGYRGFAPGPAWGYGGRGFYGPSPYYYGRGFRGYGGRGVSFAIGF